MNIWERVVYTGRSSYNGEIKVIESFGTRRLVADGYIQSQTLKNGRAFPYWDAMIPQDFSLGRGSRVLILGLGAGTVAKVINHRFGGVQIDGVEIDPLMVELGKKYFFMTDPSLTIIKKDALEFVKDARYKYDLVCIDIFKGGEVPKAVETTDFFREVKMLLREGGIVSINKIYSGESELKKFEDLVKKVFSAVESRVIRGNVASDNLILYAYK